MSAYQYVGIFGFTATNPVPLAADAAGRLIVSPPTSPTGVQASLFNNDSGSMDLTLHGLVTSTVLYAENNAASGYDPLNEAGANTDGQQGFPVGNLLTNAYLYGYNGDLSNAAAWDRVRIANVFKNVVATAAGNTAVWTPTAGKKFRLMGYTLSIAGTLAATGVNVLQLRDNATVIARHGATVTLTTPTGDTQIGVDLGQGILSSTINNVLNVNLGTAMATGGVYVNAWGTEE